MCLILGAHCLQKVPPLNSEGCGIAPWSEPNSMSPDVYTRPSQAEHLQSSLRRYFRMPSGTLEYSLSKCRCEDWTMWPASRKNAINYQYMKICGFHGL